VHSPGLKEVEKIDEIRTVFRIRTFSNPEWKSIFRYLFILEWGFKILILTNKNNILMINPHSVPALPIAIIMKYLHKCKICYDTHEIETEQYEKNSLTKIISKIIEKFSIKHCDAVITTSDGYSDWYKKTYILKQVYTVKNYSIKRCDKESTNNYLRDYCNCTNDDYLFIYQGIIAKGRGINLLIDVFTKVSNNKHIIFLGHGSSVKKVKAASENNSNIHYHTSVASSEVYNYIKCCDVGFCLIPNLHLSYFHTLPNKMLECLNVNVPVVVSNHPDMSKSITEYDAGWVTKVTSNEVFSFVDNISKEEILTKKYNSKLWSKLNTWESQESILLKCYSKMLFTKLI